MNECLGTFSIAFGCHRCNSNSDLAKYRAILVPVDPCAAEGEPAVARDGVASPAVFGLKQLSVFDSRWSKAILSLILSFGDSGQWTLLSSQLISWTSPVACLRRYSGSPAPFIKDRHKPLLDPRLAGKLSKLVSGPGLL